MAITDLNVRFSYYPPPDEDRVAMHALIRSTCQRTAEFLVATCPEGRELSLALTQLEQTMFWANAALARST
jgi:hypothetical protein